MDNMWDMISAAGSVLFVMLPLIWHLSAKLQKMESVQASLATEVKSLFDCIESEVGQLKEQLEKNMDSDRDGRKELWMELSQSKERLVKIETKMEDERS